ncbi:MAG: hypothetical protein KAJ86_01860 [Alphaproteobacteria bacterium]|nr:hypothetical protein [Alphaproteobacteria bacterium]
MDKRPKENKAVYLVVADETCGFQGALVYSARMAKKNDARLDILFVMESQDFQPWAGIAARLQGEQRSKIEQLLINAVETVYDMTGLVSSIHLEKGVLFETVLDVIDNNSCIELFVLGAEEQSGNPGPLVSYFTGKGLSSLSVPLTIVPADLRNHDLIDGE